MRGPLLVLALLGVACRPPLETDPSRAVIVTEDIPRFWSAFDQGLDQDLAQVLDREYLARGTPSLRSFLERRIGSAQRLAETVSRNRGYYASIRANTLAVAQDPAFVTDVRAAFSRVRELDPDAVFPPTALLIGRMNSGGTTSAEGILIGLELFTRAPDSPTDTLDDFERVAATSSDNLPGLVAHEHVHVLQQVLGATFGSTLLEQALTEGVADFVSEKTSARPIANAAFTYGRANEAALWAEFQAEMQGTDISRWLYNQGKDPARPGDLGYFIGYRIAEAYAARRADLATAIRELVRARDARKILEDSGYAGAGP